GGGALGSQGAGATSALTGRRTVSLNTANRGFAGLLAASLLAGVFIFCGAVGCVLVVLVVSHLSERGLAGLHGAGRNLWPAVAFIAIVGAGALAGLVSLWRQIA